MDSKELFQQARNAHSTYGFENAVQLYERVTREYPSSEEAELSRAHAIIQKAAADGVSLARSPAGTIKAAGDQKAVNRWLPALREHKPALLAALVQTSDATSATVNPCKRSDGVVITDIQMPFWSMVVFIVQVAIAAIPAIIILFCIFSVLLVLFGGTLLGILGGLLR